MRTVLYLVVFLFAISCAPQKVSRYVIQGFTQGTTYSIVYIDKKQSVTKSEISTILSDFDASCSLHNPNSLINRINNHKNSIVDTNIKGCIEIADFLNKESGGLYDITVKPLIEAYGFIAKDPTKQINIDSLLQYVGYDKIKLKDDIISLPQGVEIDLNSIAQGYSVDIVAKYLENKGLDNFLVEIGGEVYCKGKNFKGENWAIGIDKPMDGNLSPGENLQTVIRLDSGKGLATSGNYRKFRVDENGERINHTINPKTGKSVVTNLLSATVIASSAALADGYGTMLMAMGTEKAVEYLKNNPQLGAYLVYSVGDNYLIYEQ